MAFETVAQLVTQCQVAGLGACDDGAFLLPLVPDGAGQGASEVSLIRPHFHGFGTVLCDIFTDIPAHFYLVHDALFRGQRGEQLQLVRRHAAEHGLTGSQTQRQGQQNKRLKEAFHRIGLDHEIVEISNLMV